MGSPDEQLQALLGTAAPSSILALPESARAELVDAITAARHKQTADLGAAFEASLQHLPVPLRGLVKRVLLS